MVGASSETETKKLFITKNMFRASHQSLIILLIIVGCSCGPIGQKSPLFENFSSESDFPKKIGTGFGETSRLFRRDDNGDDRIHFPQAIKIFDERVIFPDETSSFRQRDPKTAVKANEVTK